MDEVKDEINDAVLYRNLYTNILSQQLHAENRLHGLLMARQSLNTTFDDHLAKVRDKVEKDRTKIQKLGERLVLLENKHMEIPTKSNLKTTSGSQHLSITKERKPSIFATLVNMESLRNHFRPRRNIVDIKSTHEINSNSQNPEFQPIIDSKQIEIDFENPASQRKPNKTATPNNTPYNHSTKANDKQRNSKKFEDSRNHVKDILPKRVSFNEIPDVIATQRTGNKEIHDPVNQEAGWSSDYSEDDTQETSNSSETHCNKQSSKRYKEPPPDFSHYSYHDRNKLNNHETLPKTKKKKTEQGRIHNQNLNRKGEDVRHDKRPKSPPKSLEYQNNCDVFLDIFSDDGNNPFKSPWEEVISTSLQKQRNDSTQAVPSSTRNNEVFQDMSSSKLAENNQTSVRTDKMFQENTSDTTTTTANLFKTEAKEPKRFSEWLNLLKNGNSKQAVNEDIQPYEHVKRKKETNFIKDDALIAMRRKSWEIDPPKKKKQKTRGRLASVFRRQHPTNNRSPAANVVKGDKKEFNVNKKVRRKMSLRPLPDTPDVEKSAHTFQFTTADSLDTFREICAAK